MTYDPFAGTFKRLLGGSGKISMTMELPSLEVLGEGSIELSEERLITLSGCDTPAVESSWRLSYTGKTGVGAPVVSVIKLVFPPATAAVTVLEKTPVVGDLVKAMKFRLYLITGGALTGKYEPGEPAVCFLGTTSVTGSITVGIEGDKPSVRRRSQCGCRSRSRNQCRGGSRGSSRGWYGYST